MADIAFLLLVFFMVTTHFLSEKGIFIEIPVGDNSTSQAQKINPKNITEIFINADGTVAMNYMDNFQPIEDIERLAELIEQKVNLRKEQMIILIKADRSAKYQRFIDVMNQVKISGAPRYSLVTR